MATSAGRVRVDAPPQVRPAVARRAVVFERRRDLARTLHSPHAPLADGLARLREQADAYRAHAIALSARLSMLEESHHVVRELRQRLIESSTQLDRAVSALLETSGRRPRPRRVTR
jgi:hypothetical protein